MKTYWVGDTDFLGYQIVMTRSEIWSHFTFCTLQIEPGLGLSETFYHWTIAAYCIGEVLGAIFAGYIVSRIPFWYSTMLALLIDITGFVFYATAINGWMMITSQVLAGMFSSLANVLAFAYFGVSYPLYLEALGNEERVREQQKTTKVKDRLFSFYGVAAHVGFLFGPGLFTVF